MTRLRHPIRRALELAPLVPLMFPVFAAGFLFAAWAAFASGPGGVLLTLGFLGCAVHVAVCGFRAARREEDARADW